MITMSISRKKPNWTVRTRSRKERWGYVLRASVGPNGQTPSVPLSVVEAFHRRAGGKGYEVCDFDLAAVLRSAEFGRERGMRVISVAVRKSEQDAARKAALALLPDDLAPAQRWACGLTVGRASAWLGLRLVGARRPLDDVDSDAAPQPVVPADAESVWRCLTLLDEVPGARAAFDELRALAADGWRYADNGPNAERFRGMKRDFRYGADWTPFLLAWDAIEAMVRAARAAFEADPDGEATERAWRIADDLVKRHHVRVDRVVARMPDGGEAWMELDEFLSFIRNHPAVAGAPKKPTASELRDILDKLNADGKPGDPTWSLDLA